MYVYRNKNTEQVVQQDEPNWRLEQLDNWERIVGDEPTPPEPEPEPELQTDIPLDLTGLGETPAAVDGTDDVPPVDDASAPEPAADTDDVPDGVMADVLEWVGEDADRARAALEAEQQREKPRATLVSTLELMLKDDDEADGE